MPLDAGMRKRFQEELDAKGIDNYKEASVKAKWPDGTPLGATYIRDALFKEKRGGFQGIELICRANGLDWEYVKTGKRQLLSLPSPKGTERDVSRLDFDALRDLIEAALRLYGAGPQDAASTAKTVLLTWRGRQSPD